MSSDWETKPFTSINLNYQSMPNLYRQFLNKKFIYNHPQCTYFKINKESAIAYYSDPIYVAILLNKSRKYICHMSLLENWKTYKLHPRVLTVSSINEKNRIKQMTVRVEGCIIEETDTKLIIKCRNFFRTTLLLRQLKKAGIKTKFTPKKIVKQILQ